MNRSVKTPPAPGSAVTIDYALDGVGNRTAVTGGPDAGTYTMDPTVPDPADFQVNQYTSAGGTSIRRYYDDNGNFIAAAPEEAGSDFNADGKVDADDVAHMAACRTGPTVSQDDQSCWDADYDGDGDVDQDDFGVFQRCYSGAQTPPAGCGNPWLLSPVIASASFNACPTSTP